MQCNAMQCNAMQCNAMQCNAMQYNTIQYNTLCMKLSWFCHTNSGQLFCNCPLFVIALVPGLFFGDEICCHSVVASKWLKTRVSQFALQDENTTTSTQTEMIKCLAGRRLKKLEEQCIHYFKLINYDYVNIMDH